MLESQVRSMCTSDAAQAAAQEPFHPSPRLGPPSPQVAASAAELLARPVDVPAAPSGSSPVTTAAPLAVTVTFGGGRVRLAVDGELDVFTSPQLVAIVDTTLAQGHRDLTFDLVRLRFIDAAGLRAIAGALDGVGGSRACVRVANASPLARRLFHIVGLSSLVDLDDTAIGRQTDRRRYDDELTALLDGLGWVSTRPSPEVVDEMMSSVVTLVGAVIADAKAVSVTLCQEKRLVTAAADGGLGRALDGVQYEAGEGPCVEAAVQGTQVAVPLAGDDRWPQFATACRAHEVRGVVSTPIVVAGEPAGALNVYLQRHDLRDDDRVLPELMAAHAATMLIGVGASADEDPARDAFLVALAERDLLGRAEGALMERLGLSADDAQAELRHRSLAHGTRLRHEVEAVLAETQRQRPATSAGSNDRAG
jgi:anti-anti-sigma factor